MTNPSEQFQGQLQDVTERIIGCFRLVQSELGTGFLESVYRRALSIALQEQGFQVEQEVPIRVWFHGEEVGTFRADLVVNGLILIELKIGEEVIRPWEAQLMNYLRATTLEIGFIFAFGSKATVRRMELDNKNKRGIHPS